MVVDQMKGVDAADRLPGFSILPFVLERAVAPRHMLPSGKQGRPIYRTASPKRAKSFRGLTQPHIPGNGL